MTPQRPGHPARAATTSAEEHYPIPRTALPDSATRHLINLCWRTVNDAFLGLASGEVDRRWRDCCQRPDLLDARLDDRRMLMADIKGHPLAREIQIAAAGVIPHPRAKPARNDEWVKGAVRGSRVEREGSVELGRALVQPHLYGDLDGAVIHEYQVCFRWGLTEAKVKPQLRKIRVPDGRSTGGRGPSFGCAWQFPRGRPPRRPWLP